MMDFPIRLQLPDAHTNRPAIVDRLGRAIAYIRPGQESEAQEIVDGANRDIERATPNQEQTVASKNPVERELAALRKAQAREVMPIIGPLLDAWEGLPNDVQGMDDLTEVADYMNALQQAMDAE